ncbi:MAG: hypothetical protein LQ342_007467 [Letrouitia transgressa]|nr:MAG: hypothetical protein LQ342_007467 [Letrouitia transgressa]
MSFGVGVGDVVAVVGLLERIAIELRNYDDAPIHFRQTSAELHLFHRALSRLLKIEPLDEGDKEWIDQIRAIAIQSHQPLLIFIERMKPKEITMGLNNGRRTMALNTIGRRLHWSLIAKKDVAELRKVVVASMTAVNMMLGIHQLTSLKKLSSANEVHLEIETDNIDVHFRKVYAANATFLNTPKPEEGPHINPLGSILAPRDFAGTVSQGLENLSLTSETLAQQSNCIVKASSTIQEHLAKSIVMIVAIANDVKCVLRTLETFSRELLAKIAANGDMLLGIHRMLKRLVRALEAIPLHLSLSIVRLDDALGESWALPYQACQTFASFKNILQVVVFGNGRPGARRVLLDQIVLRSAKDGVTLDATNWHALVKQGSHVCQAMVLDKTWSTEKTCAFPNCHGSISPDGSKCVLCGRQSTFQILDKGIFELDLDAETRALGLQPSPQPSPPARNLRKRFGPMTLKEVDTEDDEISLFRSVHYTETREPIRSIDEAFRVLQISPHDPRALRYYAILQEATQHDTQNVEGWYLLGRAWMEKTPKKNSYREAYQALQQAVYLNNYCSHIWNTVGILFFNIDQYRDSFDGFARSLRINRYHAAVWRNIGVLYDHCNQPEDARNAYQQAVELGPYDEASSSRILELEPCVQNKQHDQNPWIKMSDLDLSVALNYDEQAPINEDGWLQLTPVDVKEESDDFDNPYIDLYYS